MKPMKNLALCIMTVAMLVLQLVSPASVRADGETPPPATESTFPTPDPVETSTPIPAPVEALEPTVDTTAAVLSPDVPAEALSPSSVLEVAQTMADNTNVVVLDENGQSLSLASQEAAQVITTSDPVWCPAGQAPTPGTNGCTASYATLADLVANEGGNIVADGTIWITSGPVPEVGPVTVDGSTYATWSNYALTLQGGWSGTSGDAIIGSNSIFSVPVAIINWNNSIVMNNVNIENVVTSGTDWLKVQTNSGDITISNSNIHNNTNTSAIAAGVQLYTPENVTINNSNFDNNTGRNDIYSVNLTISNSNFTNTQNAMQALGYFSLVDCSSGTMSNVFISNSNFINNSGGFGFGVVPVSLTCHPDTEQYHINATIENSSFNDNMASGAVLFSSNVTINNSTFNNNGLVGVDIISNVTINNSVISGNQVGITFANDVTLNDVVIANNEVGIESPCTPNLQLTLNRVHFVGNGVDIGSKILDCAGTPFNVVTSDATITIISQSEGEFALDCASVDGYSVSLLNGDLVQLFCPVSGRAHISSLDDTALPAPLPADYSYGSAFSLDILQNETPIPVITEGGFLKASFAAPVLQTDDTFSILYWDNETWVPLKELTLDENGRFQLNPDASEDAREILSGVKIVTVNGSARVEVSTNFPGIFVLAQH